jgi:molecular chaperone DnaK (HSP70)
VLAKDNHFLGVLPLIKDVPPKPKGEVSMDATFEIDANGILKIEVTEPLTKQTVKLTI